MRQGRLFYGWYLVIATVVMTIYTGGTLFYGFGVFFKYILEDYDWGRSSALVYGILTVEGTGLMIFWGWLVDRVGSRMPLIAGALMTSAGFFILSRMDGLVGFTIGFGLTGIGASVVFTAPSAAIVNWFRRRRALAMGISATGFGLSGATLPLLVRLIESVGWRTAALLAAAGALVIVIPCSLVFRHRPEDYGQVPDGDPEGPEELAARTGRETLAPETTGAWTPSRALRTQSFWLLAVMYGASLLTISTIAPHVFVYTGDLGVSSETAALVMALLTNSSIIGRVGGGALGDRYPKPRIMACALLLVTAGTLVLGVATEPWHLFLFALLAGPGYGVALPLMYVMVSDYFGTRAFALILGFSTAPATAFLFGAPYFAGWASDVIGTYRPAWIAIALATGICAALALRMRPPQELPVAEEPG